MNDTQMLVGSLSNDLFRVASLYSRGSILAAQRFLVEAKRWAKPLSLLPTKPYINNISIQINQLSSEELNEAKAEECLMYGVLLQNYSLHSK